MNKFNSFKEMDNFLKRMKLSKLTQKEVDNINSPVSVEEIEFIFKSFQQNSAHYSFILRNTERLYQNTEERTLLVCSMRPALL